MIDREEVNSAALILGVEPYDLYEALHIELARPLTDPAKIEFHDKGQCTCAPKKFGWRHYTVDGAVVASVSQIIGVVDKSGPLQGYAARVTREAIVHMMQNRIKIPRDQQKLNAKFYALGLHYNQKTTDAQDRGTAIHLMGEEWITEGKIPNPLAVKAEWRGWVRSLSKFLRECEPTFHESEIMVGSGRYAFAGRRDTVATCVEGKGKLTRAGRGLIDFKTSKGIYPESQYVQLAGYDLGGQEIGQEPTDWQAIVQLGEDGNYSVGYSTATHDDFLAYLAAFNARRGVVDRAKAAA